MSAEKLKLLVQALKLTEQERAELAVDLIASLAGAPDADAESAWSAEVERRARLAIAGKTAGIPWADAKQELLDNSISNEEAR